jgi:transposase-like protein
LRALSKRYGINQKTVAKWRKRASTVDLPTGPKEPRSTVLSVEEEAVIVAFRRYTLLPLDDCLYALQLAIPHLTRSSLHRCLQRHGIARLPDVEGDKPPKKKFKIYPIGYFHIDIAEVRTEQGAGLDGYGLSPELRRHLIEQRLIETSRQKLAAEAHKGHPFRRALISGKAAESPERGTVIQGFGQLHVGEIVPNGNKKRLDAKDGHAGSPLAAP